MHAFYYEKQWKGLEKNPWKEENMLRGGVKKRKEKKTN